MTTNDRQQAGTKEQDNRKVVLINELGSYIHDEEHGERFVFFPEISVEIEDRSRMNGSRNVAYINPERSCTTPRVPLSEAGRAVVDRMVESGNVIIHNGKLEPSLMLRPLNWKGDRCLAYHPDDMELKFPVTVEEKDGHMVGTDAQGYEIARDKGLAECIFNHLKGDLDGLQDNPEIRVLDGRFMQELRQLAEEAARQDMYRLPAQGYLRSIGLANRTGPGGLAGEQEKDLQRLSRVSLHLIDKDYGYKDIYIHALVDGRELPAKAMYEGDHILFLNNRVSKEELALKYYAGELHPERPLGREPYREVGFERIAGVYPGREDIDKDQREMLRVADTLAMVSREMEMPDGTRLEWMIDPFHRVFSVGNTTCDGFERKDIGVYDTSLPFEENLQNLKEEFSRKPEYNDRVRISDVSVMMMGIRGPHIRCRIDGEQQGAVPMGIKDYAAARTQSADKVDLAVKYFREELDNGRGREQAKGMGR